MKTDKSAWRLYTHQLHVSWAAGETWLLQDHKEVGGECFAHVPCRCGQQALLPGCKLLLIHLSAQLLLSVLVGS